MHRHPQTTRTTSSGTASASPIKARCCVLLAIVVALSSALNAQEASAVAQPKAGSNWERVKALPGQTNVHIATDHGGKTCRIFAVGDETLTCAKGGQAGTVLQRAEIKRIKLTHYGRSTLVGAAIGGGIGATAGAVSGRSKPCSSPQDFCLGNVGIGAGGVAAIVGAAGGAVGGIIGGTTDLARGGSIYIRP